MYSTQIKGQTVNKGETVESINVNVIYILASYDYLTLMMLSLLKCKCVTIHHHKIVSA